MMERKDTVETVVAIVFGYLNSSGYLIVRQTPQARKPVCLPSLNRHRKHCHFRLQTFSKKIERPKRIKRLVMFRSSSYSMKIE
jgi:hypothetical protein